MDISQFKNDVATNISNKTAPNTITPAQVGKAITDLADLTKVAVEELSKNDVVKVVSPASKNLFNKEAIPAENRGKTIGIGNGDLVGSTITDTSDYIDISKYPVGTAFLMRSISTGKGARRFAAYRNNKEYTSTIPSIEEPRLFFTKTSTSQYYIRMGIEKTAVNDFQLEVAVNETDAPTPYVAYKPERTIIKSISDVAIPSLDDVEKKLDKVENAVLVPTADAAKLATLPVAAEILKTTDIVSTNIPASKNLFNKNVPTENINKQIAVGDGFLQDYSNAVTSDYIDVSKYPIGTVFLFRSKGTGRGARRFSGYLQNKNYTSTAPSISNERMFFTKTSLSTYYIRVSVLKEALEDFQIEVALAETDAPTEYALYSPAMTVVSKIAGYDLLAGAGGTSTGELNLVNKVDKKAGYDLVPVDQIEKLAGLQNISTNDLVNKSTDIVKTTIPASKNLFNKNQHMLADGVGKVLSVGQDVLNNSADYDTSDFINVAAYREMILKGYSASTTQRMYRVSFYRDTKAYIYNATQIATTRTVPSTATYMRISIRKDSIADYMLELVTSDTDASSPYVPYQPEYSVIESIAGVKVPIGEINSKIDNKADLVVKKSSGTTVYCSGDSIQGSTKAPITGNIILNLFSTSEVSKLGASVMMFHKAGVEPTFTFTADATNYPLGVTIEKVGGEYQPSELNYIYIHYVEQGDLTTPAKVLVMYASKL